jgi:hypothetical protein
VFPITGIKQIEHPFDQPMKGVVVNVRVFGIEMLEQLGVTFFVIQLRAEDRPSTFALIPNCFQSYKNLLQAMVFIIAQWSQRSATAFDASDGSDGEPDPRGEGFLVHWFSIFAKNSA